MRHIQSGANFSNMHNRAVPAQSSSVCSAVWSPRCPPRGWWGRRPGQWTSSTGASISCVGLVAKSPGLAAIPGHAGGERWLRLVARKYQVLPVLRVRARRALCAGSHRRTTASACIRCASGEAGKAPLQPPRAAATAAPCLIA